MADDPVAAAFPSTRVRRALLAGGFVVLVVAMLLPRLALRWLRIHFQWFNVPMGWMETLAAWHINLVHVLLFGWVAGLAATLLPWRAVSRLVGGLAALAVATELVQFGIPGRHPRVADLAWDAVGIALGVALALAWRARRRAPGVVQVRQTQVRRRAWLAALLRDEAMADAPDDPATLAKAAGEEGVAALVHARLAAMGAPAPWLAAFAPAARGAGAESLLQQAECARLTARFAAAGIDSLLLKGAALAYWLYPSPHLRESCDIDVLVASRGEADRAIAVLVAAGYTLPVPVVPGDLAAFELLCMAPGGRSAIDLHWQLCNSALFAGALGFAELRAHAQPLPAIGPDARGLSPPHALVHACVHRALKQQFGEGDGLRLLVDIALLAARLDDRDWRRLVVLARERGVASACAHGFAAAVEVGAKVPADAAIALADAARHERVDVARLRNWPYAQWSTLRALPTWPQRARWLRQRLLPDRAFLRSLYGTQGQGWGAIVLARLRDGWRRLRGSNQ